MRAAQSEDQRLIRDRAIWLLKSDGMTPREIAAAARLSRRTVQARLQALRALAKRGRMVERAEA